MSRPPTEITAAMVAALLDGQKSRDVLMKAMGLAKNKDATFHRHLDPFRAAGLIRICRWITASRLVYEWQPTPHALPDVPRPAKSERSIAAALNAARREAAKKPAPSPWARSTRSALESVA